MKSIVWSDRALTRRDEIFDYIAEDNPEAAIDLDTSFEVAVERLRDFPLSGRTGKVEGTRELIVTSNYIVIYQISDKTIDIITQFVMRRQMNKGSSGKSVLCLVNGQYPELEKIQISVAIGVVVQT